MKRGSVVPTGRDEYSTNSRKGEQQTAVESLIGNRVLNQQGAFERFYCLLLCSLLLYGMPPAFHGGEGGILALRFRNLLPQQMLRLTPHSHQISRCHPCIILCHAVSSDIIRISGRVYTKFSQGAVVSYARQAGNWALGGPVNLNHGSGGGIRYSPMTARPGIRILLLLSVQFQATSSPHQQ